MFFFKFYFDKLQTGSSFFVRSLFGRITYVVFVVETQKRMVVRLENVLKNILERNLERMNDFFIGFFFLKICLVIYLKKILFSSPWRNVQWTDCFLDSSL